MHNSELKLKCFVTTCSIKILYAVATVLDINECEVNNGGCELHCTNIDGGHKCACEVNCKPGYLPEENRCLRKCLASYWKREVHLLFLTYKL